ncbi:MAG: diguanylate cyclase [Endomicrobiales bacterium]|nr:diguanylate cyclase [Endomicrobiales bacterium]
MARTKQDKLKIEETVELKKRVTKEILQTVVVPIISGILLMIWIYRLVNAGTDKILVFPLSSLILLVLYFFSELFYSGILLGILTLIGFLNIVLNPSDLHRLIFFLEILWLWVFFFLLERYRRDYNNEQNRIREEGDIMDTKMSMMDSKIEEDQRICDNLKQQISNYQLLGGMVQIVGSTLHEDKIIPLVSDLAKKIIGKGAWSVRRATQNDAIVKFIKDNNLPLLVNDMNSDERIYIQNPRFNSLIAIPLEVDGGFWGILRGVAAESSVFNESDLRILSILGGITSLALNNAKLYDRTQELAITDGLTGLYVHSYFKERMVSEILRSRNHNLDLSVLILDVDHFKKFNDTYGHVAGDSVLRQIANILRNSLRETDLISRYGGEEFAVIMLQTRVNEAKKIADVIRRNIEKEKFYLPVESFQPIQVRVTISIGVSGLNDKIENIDNLLELADKALYKAKNKGRNRVEVD